MAFHHFWPFDPCGGPAGTVPPNSFWVAVEIKVSGTPRDAQGLHFGGGWMIKAMGCLSNNHGGVNELEKKQVDG